MPKVPGWCIISGGFSN